MVVLEAALEELGDVGYGAFTIESVAARAAVAKSTIYRHWSDKLALIADAFETFHEQMVPGIDSGSPRDRVERLVRHVAEVVVDSTFSVCIPALIEGAERDPRLREFHHTYSVLGGAPPDARRGDRRGDRARRLLTSPRPGARRPGPPGPDLLSAAHVGRPVRSGPRRRARGHRARTLVGPG